MYSSISTQDPCIHRDFDLTIIKRVMCVYPQYTDDNECTMGTNNCHTNAECTNTPGSFSCACVEGYSGDGVDCQGMLKIVIVEFKTSYILFKK